MYTTSISNAAIGSIAFEQQPVESEFIERWIARAIELFDADKRTVNARWVPEMSEILVTLEDVHDIDDGLEEGDDVDEYYYNGELGFVAIALECMDEASEQLCNES